MSAKHPLELVLRVNGTVDLLDADEETVWTSDGDNDFWEFIDTDFVEESDIDEILGYLEDCDIVDSAELESFENGEFDIIIEEPDDTVSNVTDAEVLDETDET